MAIVIDRSPSGTINLGDTVTYSIVSGAANSSLYASFKWYLNGNLIGTDSTLSLIVENAGSYDVKVEVDEYCEVFWYDGQFYGGYFEGYFSGGTFHYGYLNGCYYEHQAIKPKPFILNSQSSTSTNSSKDKDKTSNKSFDIVYNTAPRSPLTKLLKRRY